MRMELTFQEGRAPLCICNQIVCYFVCVLVVVGVFGKMKCACIYSCTRHTASKLVQDIHKILFLFTLLFQTSQ